MTFAPTRDRWTDADDTFAEYLLFLQISPSRKRALYRAGRKPWPGERKAAYDTETEQLTQLMHAQELFNPLHTAALIERKAN